eukprot:CAMPEP_0182617504 /NCGR_PEP_ID=MMETSP1330-20130603/42223_1 /TAXON_ID=464278 /ORGANISM="Picochlorum sp., Strain RCC944" /LENGTH=49 /DNA_ID= /DNA_START= /DNA_END= /DNA_ORIENTATION=
MAVVQDEPVGTDEIEADPARLRRQQKHLADAVVVEGVDDVLALRHGCRS